MSETRAVSATYFLPTEDEWYKAAYYDPRAEAAGGAPGNGHYWLYPSRSDIAPKQEVPPGSRNGANFNFAAGGTTEVGAYRTTTSFYGTFDQGGNVWEWNEAVIAKAKSRFRGLRGGSWDRGAPRFLSSSFRDNGEPEDALDDIGFRVASKADTTE